MACKDKEKILQYRKKYEIKHRNERRAAAKLCKYNSRSKINGLKEKDGCYDCKKRFPHYVLEFHHENSKNKKFAICHVVNSKNLLEKELTKCVVLCANCHKARHYFERIANGVAKGTRTGLHVSSERQVHEGTCISGSHDR